MNGRNSKDIEYHSHDQRKHYRLTTPFWVHVENHTYKTNDWSVGGLSIDGFHREVEYGEVLELKIIIKFQGFNIEFNATAKALATNNNILRLKFEKLTDRSKNILQFFSQSIISGEMVDFEDTIKRIDMPINLQEENIDEYRKTKKPLHRWPLKAIFFTVFYLTAGLLLFLYLSFIIYSNFVHLKVESAVVSAPTETLVSPFNGKINKVFVTKNTRIRVGDPLVNLQDHDLDQQLEIELSKHEEAKAEHQLHNKYLDTEKNKLKIYQQIGNTKHTELESNLHEWEERHEQVYNDHQRALKLYEKNVISKSELDKFESDYETVKHQLSEAKHQLKSQKQSLAAIDTGHYFSEDKLQGDLPQYEANASHAKTKIETSKQRIAAIKHQIDARLIKAPFDGHIVDVFKSKDTPISRGDDLMLLERDEKRSITAYLTQDEVVEIQNDNKVTVYIPAIKMRFNGKVMSIERGEGFIDDINSSYKGRTVNERTAMVEIELTDFTKNDTKNVLSPGTPAVVYFDRSLWDGIKHRVNLIFSDNHKPSKENK